jgi:hypothetical protein
MKRQLLLDIRNEPTSGQLYANRSASSANLPLSAFLYQLSRIAEQLSAMIEGACSCVSVGQLLLFDHILQVADMATRTKF